MKQANFSKYLLITSLLLGAAFISCADHPQQETKSPSYFIRQSEELDIPSEVAVPSNAPIETSRVATYYAVGVQKYKARVKIGTNPIAYEWVFVAPEAELFDINNAKIGTHFAGPSWKLDATNDLIMAQPYIPARTASKDANSIDWLLLSPKSGTTPTGIFEEVHYIQRIATKGGKAPAVPPSDLLETVDVPYTAVYRFSRIDP